VELVEPHLLTGRSVCILLGDRLLNLDGALHGVYSAGKIGKNAVARSVEDPNAMRGDQPINDDPVGRKSAKGSYLISPHQAATPSTSAAKIAASFLSTVWASKVRHLPDRV
jgi:hypothetical protein